MKPYIKLDINCPYKRWLFGGIFDELNIKKRICNQDALSVLDELNIYFDILMEKEENKQPFNIFKERLVKKANSLAKIYEEKESDIKYQIGNELHYLLSNHSIRAN
jgi:hypothetical protein